MAKEKSASLPSTPEKDEESSFRYDISNLSVIASPLASEKLSKKLFKVVKKATKAKHLKRGVKEVVKSIRKGQKGLVLLAGDINPIDVITHIPVYCEENNIPYVFVPEKSVLGLAAGSKRPTSCLMICPSDLKSKTEFDYKDKFDECVEKIKDLPIPISQ